jgi:hypothetical protein
VPYPHSSRRLLNALKHLGQLIVFDIKGEVFAATAEARRAMGQEVHVLDLRDDAPIERSLNPLDLVLRCGTEPVALARGFAAELVLRGVDERDPFWNDWAETMITGGTSWLLADCPPGERRLSALFDCSLRTMFLTASPTSWDFHFTGFTSNGSLAIFWPSNNESFTMTKGPNAFERSDIPVLYYDVPDNLFYAALSDLTLAGMPTNSPFYNPNLSTVSSPFSNSLESLLDPASLTFDPPGNLFVTIQPDTNFDTVTSGFATSGESDAGDAQFVADTPEPSSLTLLLWFWPA